MERVGPAAVDAAGAGEGHGLVLLVGVGLDLAGVALRQADHRGDALLLVGLEDLVLRRGHQDDGDVESDDEDRQKQEGNEVPELGPGGDEHDQAATGRRQGTGPGRARR